MSRKSLVILCRLFFFFFFFFLRGRDPEEGGLFKKHPHLREIKLCSDWLIVYVAHMYINYIKMVFLWIS